MAPLTGLRVLDLSNVLAGPFCCHQLAHLGADVIKVEVPGRGDLARQLGADSELNQKFMGVSFLAQNAGKRSVTLNLKSPKGIALLKKLLLSADVLVENFRPGVMERLGTGWEVLREINPRLVYCAISGFGQDGPWRDLPAYDQIIQGASGVMSITGDADTAPYRVGYPISDTIGGLTAAFAITAALQGRSAGGGGSFIDVSMLEATMATMGWVLSNWLIAGQRPSANGNENFTSAPSGTFRTADAPLNIAANKQEQWEILCRHLGREELLQHPDYVTREARKVNREALKTELEKTLAGRPASDWADELNRLGVPAGTVMEVPDILAHPQIADRGMIAGFDDVPGVGRGIRVARTGIKLDGEAPSVQTPPPQLGEHNADIYGELGLTAGEIADLQKEKVI
jgi:crotonobetainyl-CoA:carnitine CoA-transferase CaiB-like acyl-CoA transferase